MSDKIIFHLADELSDLKTDPSTADDPIKRSFFCDGEHVSANLSILENPGNAIHVQPNHDEFVLILEGECGFRVGDHVGRVREGDLIFIPRNTEHGPIVDSGRIAVLSIFAPYFDRDKRNIRWARDDYQ